MSSFREKIGQGKILLGTLVTMSSPTVSEILSKCGFDWLCIDMEHTPLSLGQVQVLTQAKVKECAVIVRIPVNDETWIKQVLDLGVDGIIIPQVKTAEEAKRAVLASKYPPFGQRSVGMARAHDFGMEFSKSMEGANHNTAVIILVEDVQGADQIEDIVQVSGIDAIMIGPYDLSGSLGKLGDTEDVEVQKILEKIYRVCSEHNMPRGIFALQPELGKAYLKRGYQLLAVGMDMHYLWSAAKESLSRVKDLT